MTWALRIVTGLALMLAVGCSPPPTHGKGGACYAITDCKPGLACADGKCTNDVSKLAQGDAPPFTMFVDAAAADAGVSTDGGAGDAAPAGSEGGTQDAAVSTTDGG